MQSPNHWPTPQQLRDTRHFVSVAWAYGQEPRPQWAIYKRTETEEAVYRFVSLAGGSSQVSLESAEGKRVHPSCGSCEFFSPPQEEEVCEGLPQPDPYRTPTRPTLKKPLQGCKPEEKPRREPKDDDDLEPPQIPVKDFVTRLADFNAACQAFDAAYLEEKKREEQCQEVARLHAEAVDQRRRKQAELNRAFPELASAFERMNLD